MSRTLADMTPAERAECDGRWCETSSPRGLGILALADDERQDCIVLAVDSRDSWLHDLAEVTPPSRPTEGLDPEREAGPRRVGGKNLPGRYRRLHPVHAPASLHHRLGGAP